MVYFNDLIDNIRDLDIDLKVISDNKGMSIELKNEWKIKIIDTLVSNVQPYIDRANQVVDKIPTTEPAMITDPKETKAKNKK